MELGKTTTGNPSTQESHNQQAMSVPANSSGTMDKIMVTTNVTSRSADTAVSTSTLTESLHGEAVTSILTASQPSNPQANTTQNPLESNTNETVSLITADIVPLGEHAGVPGDTLHSGLLTSQKDGEAQTGADDSTAQAKTSSGVTAAQIVSITCLVVFLVVCLRIGLYFKSQVIEQKLVLRKVMPLPEPVPHPKLAFMVPYGIPPDMAGPATKPAVTMSGSLPHLLPQRMPNEGNTKCMPNSPELLKTNTYLAQLTLETLPGGLPSVCSIQNMSELV